jgi:hypothetical protein
MFEERRGIKMKRGTLILLMLIIAGIAYADTWRYGSPGDVRRAGIRASQDGYRGGYDGHRGYRGYRDHALSTWMDIAFRAGSPELYRYTQPAAPQINIYNNITVYGDGHQGSQESTGTIDYVNRRDRNNSINYHVPRYPAAAVP